MRYRIGDLELDLTGLPLVSDEMADCFISRHSGAADITYRKAVLDTSLPGRSRVLQYTGSYELLRTERGLFLMNHWETLRYAYGFWMDELDGDTVIFFHPDFSEKRPLNVSRFLSAVGLHRKFLRQRALVVHASYIEYRGRAILFMGPSGIGKSTQAELWNRCENAPILNGDRVLLRQIDGHWYAYGYPACGSSRVCVNRTLPLGAIVPLQQSRENQIQQMTPARRVCALMAASELYPWERTEMELVLELTQELSRETMICLACRADGGAVRTLRDELERTL